MRVRQTIVVVAACLLLSGCDRGSGSAAPATTTIPRSTGRIAAVDLAVGDCVNGVTVGQRERGQLRDATVVDCRTDHQLEVYARFEVTHAGATTAASAVATGPSTVPGAGATTTTFPVSSGHDGYPGLLRVVDEADEECIVRLRELGTDESVLGVLAIWPTQTSWSTGDRDIVCAAYRLDGRAFTSPRLLADA